MGVGNGICWRDLDARGMVGGLLNRGTNLWYPPNDEQLIMPSTAIADTTAAGAFSLSAAMTATGGYLMHPARVFFVLRNRGTAASGPPGLTQVNPTFAGNDQMQVRVTGELDGATVSETLTINIATITTPAATQRSHILTTFFYDRITEIFLLNTLTAGGAASAFGTVTPLLVCAGIGNCELGDASTNRMDLAMPWVVDTQVPFKRLMFPDMTSFGVGSGLTNMAIQDQGRTLTLPGKAAEFRTNASLFTVQVGADTLTKVAHGLALGNLLRLESDGDGLPGNTAENTKYYVAGTLAADTIQLALTPGGAVIDLTAAGTFADGEAVRVLRPTQEWRQMRPIWNPSLALEAF